MTIFDALSYTIAQCVHVLPHLALGCEENPLKYASNDNSPILRSKGNARAYVKFLYFCFFFFLLMFVVGSASTAGSVTLLNVDSTIG